MDKVTQAILANKVASLTSEIGDDLFGTADHENENKQNGHQERYSQQLKTMDDLEAERMDQHHRRERNDEAREKIRNDIRNKYKLKGSQGYKGSYYKRQHEEKLRNKDAGDDCEKNYGIKKRLNRFGRICRCTVL